jgi:hypothetical protein
VHGVADTIGTVETHRPSDCGYPWVWVRWVRQQLSIAVAYELAAPGLRKVPHLRGLALSVDPEHGDRVEFLRQLITALAGTYQDLDPADRCDRVAAAVLREPGVRIAEPELTVMVAWRLAQHRPLSPQASDLVDVADPFGEDHECFDPESVAAELVESGLIAPSWKLREMTAQYTALLHTRAVTPPASRSSSRRRSRAGAAEQLALPFPA